MPTLQNVSPRGDLDVPLLRRTVQRGEKFECTAEQARVLLEQEENFVRAGRKPATKRAANKPPRKAAAKKAPPAADQPEGGES